MVNELEDIFSDAVNARHYWSNFHWIIMDFFRKYSIAVLCFEGGMQYSSMSLWIRPALKSHSSFLVMLALIWGVMSVCRGA